MRRVFVLITAIVFISCSESKPGIKDYLHLNWVRNNKIVLEDGHIHSYTHFDKGEKQMSGDTLIPFVIKDSVIIVSEIVASGKYEDIMDLSSFVPSSDTLVIDTLVYEFRNLMGPKLLLYGANSYYPSVFKLDNNQKINIPELKRFDNVRFEIGGFSIGDSIDTTPHKIKDVSNTTFYNTASFELSSNKDIEIEVIGDNRVFEITQRGISDFDLEDIIKVVNGKLGADPEHSPKRVDNDYATEMYTWNQEGTKISLGKVEYVGDDPIRKLYSKSKWSLSYSDDILEAILIEEFRNSNPKSTIIK